MKPTDASQQKQQQQHGKQLCIRIIAHGEGSKRKKEEIFAIKVGKNSISKWKIWIEAMRFAFD